MERFTTSHKGQQMKIKIFFAWYDLWVGLYIDKENKTLYICLIPTVVIKIQFVKEG
jgi:hypothetical protein